MQTKIKGIRSDGGTTEVDLKATRDGDLRVAQYLPPYAMLCAAGKVFAFDMSGGTAKAPVAAMPTTSPEWGIYNANTSKSIVLLRVGVISESGTLGLGLAVVCASAIGPQTAVSANYTSSVVSCLDGTAKVPLAYLTNNPTLIGGTPAWVAFAAGVQTATIDVGSGRAFLVDGLVIAPPKGMIGIEVVGPVGTTALWDINVVIAEIDLDLA